MKMVTGIGAAQTGHAASLMTSSAGAQVPLKEPVKSDRRSNKPIMEKRRRARINNCLNELKTLILDATKKDPARHSKLEKADILEKTVKYLQDLQRQQAVLSLATDPKVVNKFKAGFTECANEVSRFPGMDPMLKRRLLQHLNNYINGVKSIDMRHSEPSPQTVVQVHMMPSPPSSPEQDQQLRSVSNHSAQLHLSNSYFLPNGLQVISTKLQNGSYALVVPHSVPQATPIPTLVPIPSRTSSTSSAASAPCSSYERMTSVSPAAGFTAPSPTSSYEMMDCKPSVIQHSSMSNSSHFQYCHIPQSYSPSPSPLSLVIKKERDEDQPWRPW